MSDDAGEAARRMLAIAFPKEKGVSYVYDGDRRRADMQLVASDWLAQAKRIEELESALIAMLEPYAPLVDGELSSRQLYRVQQARAALQENTHER